MLPSPRLWVRVGVGGSICLQEDICSSLVVLGLPLGFPPRAAERVPWYPGGVQSACWEEAGMVGGSRTI